MGGCTAHHPLETGMYVANLLEGSKRLFHTKCVSYFCQLKNMANWQFNGSFQFFKLNKAID